MLAQRALPHQMRGRLPTPRGDARFTRPPWSGSPRAPPQRGTTATRQSDIGHATTRQTNKHGSVGGFPKERGVTRPSLALSQTHSCPGGTTRRPSQYRTRQKFGSATALSLTRRGGYELGDLLDSPLSAHFSHISLRSALPTPSRLLRPQRRQASLSRRGRKRRRTVRHARLALMPVST